MLPLPNGLDCAVTGHMLERARSASALAVGERGLDVAVLVRRRLLRQMRELHQRHGLRRTVQFQRGGRVEAVGIVFVERLVGERRVRREHRLVPRLRDLQIIVQHADVVAWRVVRIESDELLDNIPPSLRTPRSRRPGAPNARAGSPPSAGLGCDPAHGPRQRRYRRRKRNRRSATSFPTASAGRLVAWLTSRRDALEQLLNRQIRARVPMFRNADVYGTVVAGRHPPLRMPGAVE